MNLTVEEAKRALRLEMRRRLATMSPAERLADSIRLCERLEATPYCQGARSLLGFVPLPGEPDLLPFMRRAAAIGRQVCVPRWNAKAQVYTAALMPPDGDWALGPFGVPEPPAEAFEISLEQLDLVLVPGLAFDTSGRRLGRGRGFFDRLLACTGRAGRWGIAFDLQLVPEVPAAPHDVNLDVLVTPGLWLPVTPGGFPE